MKKKTKIILIAITSFIVLYGVIFLTDMSRVKQLKKPIFCIENGYMGSMTRFDGLGYKIGLDINATTGEITYGQMTMIGQTIVKLYSDDDNVNNWREACRDELALLACEKNTNGSLTTLEIGAQIKLNKKSSNGAEIILEKVVDFSYKKPYWQDIETFKRFKKCDIQAIGYTILDQV